MNLRPVWGICNDRRGTGHFGALRGNRKHASTDFECIPGQAVKCPIDGGILIREHRPYKNDSGYSGLVIESERLTIRIFYCKVFPGLVGKPGKRGQTIAIVQDISGKYGQDMTPHIHLEIERIAPMLLTELVDLVNSLKSTLSTFEGD